MAAVDNGQQGSVGRAQHRHHLPGVALDRSRNGCRIARIHLNPPRGVLTGVQAVACQIINGELLPDIPRWAQPTQAAQERRLGRFRIPPSLWLSAGGRATPQKCLQLISSSNAVISCHQRGAASKNVAMYSWSQPGPRTELLKRHACPFPPPWNCCCFLTVQPSNSA